MPIMPIPPLILAILSLNSLLRLISGSSSSSSSSCSSPSSSSSAAAAGLCLTGSGTGLCGFSPRPLLLSRSFLSVFFIACPRVISIVCVTDQFSRRLRLRCDSGDDGRGWAPSSLISPDGRPKVSLVSTLVRADSAIPVCSTSSVDSIRFFGGLLGFSFFSVFLAACSSCCFCNRAMRSFKLCGLG